MTENFLQDFFLNGDLYHLKIAKLLGFRSLWTTKSQKSGFFLFFFLNKIKILTFAPSGQSWEFIYVNKSWYQWNAIFPHQDHIQLIFGHILLPRSAVRAYSTSFIYWDNNLLISGKLPANYPLTKVGNFPLHGSHNNWKGIFYTMPVVINWQEIFLHHFRNNKLAGNFLLCDGNAYWQEIFLHCISNNKVAGNIFTWPQ